ncbi:MAG: glutamate 5-kinase [Methylophilales bacterium]|jgi:glutamate 5-kinase|nr:glutamate 5-kinase [Pseudomonadota bacterium]NQW35294.1 glutamate 5-kinase [Methylophilales bacterium]|tara:strand:+ start:3976 stop:5115 length:1140 start_codon:yes stop_codon:yes gene_type:complete
MNNQKILLQSKRIVIKLGSSIITNDGNGIDEICLSHLVDQISKLANQGKEIIVVSSGAIAAGLKKLGIVKRPRELSELQAAAAVGQMDLLHIYEKLFSKCNLIPAQVLLTHEDLSDRKRYLNARSTLNNLIVKKVIPIINENDTVASDEIRFGDNDTLGAMVANLLEADLLVILTDQDGLFSDDPRKNHSAYLVEHAYIDDDRLDLLARDTTSSIGTGGMTTKIQAARKAALSGAHTIIASGRRENILTDVSENNFYGTFLECREPKQLARKKWLADVLRPKGKIFIDTGATNALINEGKSLLSVGVIKVEGNFDRGEAVKCFDVEGKEIAQGLINYSSDELDKIKGISTDKIESILGYVNELSLIHRNNLVIMKSKGK